MMIENYLLEELVAFAKYKTISATAEHLSITQPAVTRGMQKLEELLNVKLFNRTRNRITLTKTGELAAKEAEKILEMQQEFIEYVQNANKTHYQIKIYSTSPGPQIILSQESEFNIEDKLIDTSTIENVLLKHNHSIVISNQNIQTDEIASEYAGFEELRINIDAMTASLSGDEVSFSQIDGISVVTLSNLGIWQNVINTAMPNSKFMSQNTVDNFSEILSHSQFPFFTTNLTSSKELQENLGFRRKEFFIKDESAMIDYYINYRKEDKRELNSIISKIKQIWEKYM